MDTVKLHIDGIYVEGSLGQMIYDVAHENGIEIPKLCHSDLVCTYTSCGICAVEVKGNDKLVRACSTEIADGMVIYTNNRRVHENCRAILNLMLSEHRINCRPPCQMACPAYTDCQRYVRMAANGDYALALKTAKEKIPLPASIGRVCPRPCESACRRRGAPISIGTIKEFVANLDMESGKIYVPDVGKPTGKTVAIIGGGPGGLAVAYFLRRLGHGAVIFEAMPQMGGMLRYGIPEYRLPKNILDAEIAAIKGMGVAFHNNIKIGKDKTLQDLQKGYDAVVVAVGAWKAAPLGCKGEDLQGVYGGIDFLRDVITDNAPNFAGKKIAVVGGGNTAMDACRTATRLGAAQVYNIYRRTRDEMPACEIEIEEADEEGVIFRYLTNPLEIIGKDGKVSAINLQIMELGEPDNQGRRRPVAVEGKTELLDVDAVIVAIGQWAVMDGFEALKLNRGQNVDIDETFATNIPGVFAIGDVADRGAGIAIESISDASKVVQTMDRCLLSPEGCRTYSGGYDFALKDEPKGPVSKDPRIAIPRRDGSERNKDFAPVNLPLPENAVKAEAKRCLKCGCKDYHRCKLLEYAARYDIAPKRYDPIQRVVEAQEQKAAKAIKAAALTEPPIEINKTINLDQTKCVFCGLCVRACREALGINTPALAGKSLDTRVSLVKYPPPPEADCASCGKCITACHTNAIKNN
ncbi:MAG: FAD-dependent oxidoreductase [Defluviitaleaceae bacterium]|nr:FAD-dependent oxidoreductase [Defluviitaleaceae bacterium]